MKVYIVIDTNVVVSAMLTHNADSPTRLLFNKVAEGQVIPMLNDSILEEYVEVLMRPKFKFAPKDINDVCRLFDLRGIKYVPESTGRFFIDPDDQIFYETYLMRDDAYLITGNLKHYPSEPRILSPHDMMHIIHIAENPSANILNEPSYEYISEERQIQLQRALEAIDNSSQAALANGTANIPITEIDEEIRLYRTGKQQR